MIKNSTTEDMKTLASSINSLVQKGYALDFRVTEEGLSTAEKKKFYKPSEVHIRDFFRFEGASDPADSSILYGIETSDGLKGTLTDAYGAYADENVTKFMEEVEDIAKKNSGNDRTEK